MEIEVLGVVRARDDDGRPLDLRGPRHREVLGRLVAAGGRMVGTDTLVADLWAEPGPGAVGALRTFVAALRRALEPDRAARTPPRVLVTEGPGYALHLPRTAVDVVRFEDALAAVRDDPGALSEALWSGPAYADLPDSPWVQRERARLEALRLQAVETRAEVLLAAGGGAELLAELDAHVAEHPWREPAWGLLARALYAAGRQVDALATLRRARSMLVQELGLDPGPELRRLEAAVLDQSLSPAGGPPRLGPRTTVDLARTLAIAGGTALVSSRRDRLAAALAAERTGDVALTARVIGAYDVPAIWSRVDDAEQARAVVAAAERTLAALGPDGPADLRARLHATVAVECRGADARAHAESAGTLARGLGDPALLAFALNGRFLQSFHRPGLAPERDGTGAELVTLSTRHRLPTFAILGHLIRMQSASARADFAAAAGHARAADRIAADHESPLVPVLTAWFDAMVLAVRSTGTAAPSAAGDAQADTPSAAEVAAAGGARVGTPSAAEAAAAYRAADAALAPAGMPGLRTGLLPLALLGLRLLHSRPAPVDPGPDWGPYEPWAAPLVLLAQGRADAARDALDATPEPPADHLQEALWCLTAHAARRLDRPEILRRAADALRPARTEHAGAASGLLTLGPVSAFLEPMGPTTAGRRTAGTPGRRRGIRSGC